MHLTHLVYAIAASGATPKGGSDADARKNARTALVFRLGRRLAARTHS